MAVALQRHAFRSIPRRAVKGVVLALVFLLGVWAESAGLIDDLTDTYREDIILLSQQHVLLVLLSGGLAMVTAIPLGIGLSRPSMRPCAVPLMRGLNLGATLPTLAVLALAMSWLGAGAEPALFGLWVVTLLPIVGNTYAGLRAVPAHLKEAATGMGMRPSQILWRVELPHGLFVIFAGIRTALMLNVGMAPLAFLVGGGGLGALIFTGIDRNDPGMMLAGAIPAALLAVLVDFLVGLMAYLLVPKGVNPLR